MQDHVVAHYLSDTTEIAKRANLLDIKGTLETTSKLAQQLLEEVKLQPHYFIGLALIFLQKRPASSEERRFARLVILVSVALQNRLNNRAVTALLTGNLLVDAVQAVDDDKQKRLTQVLLTSVAKMRIDIARDTLKISRLLDSSSIWTYLPHCRLTYWQWFSVWSICLTQPNRKYVSWADKLTQLFQTCPAWTTPYLAGLLSFPSLIPPSGSFVNNTKSYTCLAVADNTILFFNPETAEIETATEAVECHSARIATAKWQELHKKAKGALPAPFQEAFAVTRPPGSLIEVLHMLRDDQVDIDKLATAVENEASFTQFVKQTASQGNRMALPVTSVKQGIMTHGLERLGDMLITHALINRFAQSEYPLKATLMNFISLQMMLSAELAARSGIAIPQTASLVTLIANSALFTHPALKTLTNWKVTHPVQINSPIDDLIPGAQSGVFTKSAMALSKAWTLPPRLTKQVSQFCHVRTSGRPAKVIYLLRLSLLWTLQVQQGSVNRQTVEQEELAAMKLLNLTQSDKQQLVFDCSEHLFCPLSKH